ncbi:hypothetical protein PDESU_00414 [Pontiella desulfatans]|uniref:Uncharacterized protein n=1 Tax=Pontiella desulfatans TaxID=2750659 RepID=A0A6C2TWC5_PONDE|nr:hypothetical protein [Pontiella desulfatans]VGO11867.1 hypothetical protein PDESU_00414 [Pontiella desulfatans]
MSKAYWEMIADELHAAGWSYGFSTVVDTEHGLLHYAWADKETGHRFSAQAETKMAAFIELQAICSKHNAKLDKAT